MPRQNTTVRVQGLQCTKCGLVSSKGSQVQKYTALLVHSVTLSGRASPQVVHPSPPTPGSMPTHSFEINTNELRCNPHKMHRMHGELDVLEQISLRC